MKVQRFARGSILSMAFLVVLSGGALLMTAGIKRISLLLNQPEHLEPVSNCVFDPVLGATHCHTGRLYFNGCSTPGCTTVTGVQEQPYAQTYSGDKMYTGDQADAYGIDSSKGEDGHIIDSVTLANPMPYRPPPLPKPSRRRPALLEFPNRFNLSTAPEEAVRAAGGISNLQAEVDQLATALSSNTFSLLRIRRQQAALQHDWEAVSDRFGRLQAVAGPP
eukprot:CAMPEP_0172169890 /NCGR_PEP_ID=MMETSP1050-20130122/10962_1 /TAXON_ID=233186 /ORGANISM="Cryptomonas curvata, Strain CCAP979/52" /LENGTH=219 /DNA_ID=CAMNT_0012841009 /DNA_START=72 /DNA_END=728 /DNA_ORIENTATION=-